MKKRKSFTTRDYNHLLKAITPSRVTWWQASGIFYGYPQCCIEAFCRLDHIREQAKEGSSLASDMGKGTGFIPCGSCAEKLRSGELKLRDLISGRKADRPFPKCSNTDMDLIYEMVCE
jgi:hypothetical protein